MKTRNNYSQKVQNGRRFIAFQAKKWKVIKMSYSHLRPVIIEVDANMSVPNQGGIGMSAIKAGMISSKARDSSAGTDKISICH
jgi:hypothetical protein